MGSSLIEYAAAMPLAEKHVYSVVFGHLDAVPDIRGPGDTPYYARIVIPRFLWELMGEPETIAVGLSASLDDAPLSLLVKQGIPSVFMEPVYEKGETNAA